MSLQLILVGLIVLGALVYLGRQTWRAWRGSASGCGGGCPKCPSTAAPPSDNVIHIPVEQLILRRR